MAQTCRVPALPPWLRLSHRGQSGCPLAGSCLSLPAKGEICSGQMKTDPLCPEPEARLLRALRAGVMGRCGAGRWGLLPEEPGAEVGAVLPQGQGGGGQQ